ncbi:MAG: fatty acid desaturase family protein [Alphaproteobacteria bacterium]
MTTDTRGQDFREDRRRRQGLPADVVQRLNRLDPAKATWAVVETFAVIALAVAAAIVWWHPVSVVLAMVLIATRQQAFFVLAHDAAHYRMYRTRWLNDAVGRLCGTVVGISMCTYRVVHRLHHNHLYEKQDPDIPLHGGYPRGAGYLAKKLLKDLLGFTAYKTYAYFFGAPTINDDAGAGNRPLDDTAPALRAAARRDRWVVVGFHAAAPLVAFAAGYGVEYLLLWVLPLVTVLQPLLRLRAICEHGAVDDLHLPLKAARTNTGPAWLMWLVFPHHVHYHIEHHLYPAIPHYNLPAAHRAMREAGLLDDAEVRPVWQTMRKVFAPRRAAAVAA